MLALLVASEPNRKHASPFDSRPPLNDGLGPRGSAPPQSLEDDQQAIPSFSISDRAASLVLGGDYLAEWQRAIDASLKPQSRVIDASVEIVSEAPSARRGRSANVAGLLEGNDPRLKNETVLITAHYDHLGAPGTALYPGANDNASGTAAVLELARVFTREARPRRTLLFLVFGSEEEGLLGSYYYADHPLRPLETTRAVLNLDMIARDEAHTPESQGLVDIPADTSNQLDLVGGFYSPELVKEIREAGREAGLDLSEKFDRDHDLNVLFRCDHFPFLLKDVPAIWLFGGFHPGYHRPVDTVEKLNLAKLEKVARLTYLAARRLADTPRPPRFEAAH